LLHAGGSILIRDVVVGGFGIELSERAQTRAMRGSIVVLGVVALLVLRASASVSVVDLLLLAYAIPIQFMPLVLAGLYWRRANRACGVAGLTVGVGSAVALFAMRQVAPQWYATLNPWGLQIGAIAGALNVLTLVLVAAVTAPLPSRHLARYELDAPSS
jgi:SSS family solute:Na+ symporter